jgi:hypothetical protein
MSPLRQSLLWALSISLTLAMTTLRPSPARAQEAASPAETWVLSKLIAGEIADLADPYPDASDRVISVKFLETLLAAGTPVHRNGVRLRNAVFDDEVTLRNRDIPFSLWLDTSTFNGGADFSGVHLRSGLSIDGSVFTYGYFTGMDVDSYLTMESTQFTGEALFNWVTVRDSMYANSLKTASMLDLNNARIGRDLDLSGSSISEICWLNDSVIQGSLYAADAQFESDLMLYRGKFGNVFLNRATITGATSLVAATIVGNLELDGASLGSDAELANMSVGTHILASNARFGGDLNVSSTAIQGNFDGSGLSVVGRVRLDNMKVDRAGMFQSCIFSSSVDFTGSRFGRLLVTSSNFRSSLSLANTASVYADLSDVHFERMELVDVDGFAFQHLGAEGTPKSVESLLALANHLRYTPWLYSSIEALLRKEGQPNEANDVFIAGRRHARSTMSPLLIPGDVLLDGSIGYGKKPENALAASFVVVILGWVAFRDKKLMRPVDRGARQRPYHALWYSLDVFTPLVNLGASSAWVPRKGWRIHWMRTQTILGWALATALAVAWSGLIK